MFKKWTIAMNYKKLILKIVRVIILMCNDNYRYKFQGHFIERKISVKLLPIWFDKIFKFIKINDGIRSLVIFSSEKYNAISDRTNSHISEKSGIAYSIIHHFARIRIDSYNSLPIKKYIVSSYI